ncbi:MAG: uracil-DNA glycosylase [Planctomycetales bacterium]|nr:uracil-DNA glycosylase [Planctomycetales bacterium]
MTQETDSKNGPDPAETLWQAAELAAHLARMGAEWLPAPNLDAVETLAAQFHRSHGGPAQSDDSGLVDATVRTAGEVPDSRAVEPAATVPMAPAPDRSTRSESFTLTVDQTNASQHYPGSSLPLDERSTLLGQLSDQVAACNRCEILSKCRTKTVFGEGKLNPRVVFFGEGPGRDEDLSGRPFVGKAGQLLTKMIQACKFSREDVYIMNTVKCRPPNNRNPEPTEIENCREYFEAQLNTLRPEYIVCLGLISAQSLLRSKLSVGMLRGKFHRYFDSKVVVTYHPSYLLRAPAAKKAAWDDLQMMLRDAGLM